ncbi:MAG: hypothetical protein HS124_07410 [Anaerolineales bacterium]|nr:hypothetical protein [Anaerolineales bacterium]
MDWRNYITVNLRIAARSGALLFCLILLSAAWLYFFIAPTSYIWVMDLGDQLNKTYLVKMCPNGKRLWRVQFGQSGQIAYDPNQNAVWAPELGDIGDLHYDQLVKLDQDGRVEDRIQGYRTRTLAVDPRDSRLWTQKLIAPPGQSQYDHLLAQLAPNGKFLSSRRGIIPMGIWSLSLDLRNGTVWIGASKKLIHLTPEWVILFETSDVDFFSNGLHQIAIDPLNGDVWHTTMRGDVYRRSWDGTVQAKTGGLSDPIAVAVYPQDHSAWVANYDQPGAGSVVKISPAGEILFSMETPSHAHLVGVNPYDDVVWVGYEGGILLLDQSGELLNTLAGFNTPISIAFSQPESVWKGLRDCTMK